MYHIAKIGTGNTFLINKGKSYKKSGHYLSDKGYYMDNSSMTQVT